MVCGTHSYWLMKRADPRPDAICHFRQQLLAVSCTTSAVSKLLSRLPVAWLRCATTFIVSRVRKHARYVGISVANVVVTPENFMTVTTSPSDTR
jgi:hypothetical protein